jgi:chaperonin GroEL
MYEMGIVDATKVIRCGIQNGASVAGTLLTTEGLILDDVDEIMKMNQLAKSFQAQ